MPAETKAKRLGELFWEYIEYYLSEYRKGNKLDIGSIPKYVTSKHHLLDETERGELFENLCWWEMGRHAWEAYREIAGDIELLKVLLLPKAELEKYLAECEKAE